jgi:excinuclease ABC subunit B
MTDSMRRALGETQRRREKQAQYNREHGITPHSVMKAIDSTLVSIVEADYFKVPLNLDDVEEYSPEKIGETIAQLEGQMRAAAAKFEFERAAELRDKIKYLRSREIRPSPQLRAECRSLVRTHSYRRSLVRNPTTRW